MKECLIDLTQPRPKDDDLSWTVKDVNTGKWVESTKPPYITDVDQKSKHLVNLKPEKNRRTCTCCGNEMWSGYVIRDGEEYFCSDDCLWGWYSRDEYDELCQIDEAYWTEWEINDSSQDQAQDILSWLDEVMEVKT